MKNRKFTESLNLAVITTRNIIDKSGWIGYVTHDIEDGTWQFLESTLDTPKEDQAVVVSLENIVIIDQSVIEIADLPLGWHAWRKIKGSDWVKSKKVI